MLKSARTYVGHDERDRRKGVLCAGKNVVVEFVFENVSALDLSGFNDQNVIIGLGIEKTDSGYCLTVRISVTAYKRYGLAGSIESERVSIRVIPSTPS